MNQVRPKTEKRKYKLLLIINLTAVFFLFLTYSALFINPHDFKFIAVTGLVYPFILFVNIVFILIWLLIDYRKAIFSLLAIIIGWHQVGDTFQFSTNKLNDTTITSFEVLTYNARMFDRYNWIKEGSTTNQILDFIESENPDILCIQEFYSNKTDSLNIRKQLKKHFKSNFCHIVFASDGPTIYNYGIATYSKYPIINKGSIKFEDEQEISIYSDIIIEKDTVRFYNCHLESVHFGYEDYHFIDSLGVAENNDNQYKRFKKILKKLFSAYEKRAIQAQLIAEHIKTSPYPTIIAGDFNDVPVSYVYHKISDNLNDAFSCSGSGIGNTYNLSFFKIRIDYLLYDDNFQSYEFKTHKIKLSDHYPVSCKFVLL